MAKRQRNPQKIMLISEHLREARRRTLYSLAGIILAAIIGWFLSDRVFAWLQIPLATQTSLVLNFPTIGAAFDLRLRVSLWLGLLLSSPWWILQLGLFIFPGLRRRERALALGFFFAGVILFSAGAALGVVMLPRAVAILSEFTPTGAVNLLNAETYLHFTMAVITVFGISFLFPVFLVAANFLGILPAATMLRGWRWAILGCFIFTAIANPLPNAWPMLIQGTVLVLLFFTAWAIAFLHDRARAKRLAKES